MPQPQTGRQECFQMISPIPSSIDFSTHQPIFTSLLDWSKVIIQPMKDGNGKRTRKTNQIPHSLYSCKQTPRQRTPGLSGTQRLEDLFCEPSEHNEPPITGPSQSPKTPLQPHDDALTCGPEPEVAPMQSTEEPFAHPTTPCSITIIDNTPVGSPLHSNLSSFPKEPNSLLPPVSSSSHSHNEAQQEFTDL
ncbi:hypothetical protein O181_001676 [Austropuccinia psidii MF-1]|uniref:Uncharacterized protein n=1 Tax=Austropuccinia psidii MF-1 TaxID=1389203 RepID=A0A9Q3BBH1_9BASI|nr:hypothetical protein [Austropuccinia psidii MF-1]